MSDRISKYLLYALGEILLVVIGILIALQVNNWNESKRTRKTEIKLLTELKEDLIKTKEDLLTDIIKTNILMEITDSIYQKVMQARSNKTGIEVKISNSYLTDYPMLFPKLSAYKSIQAYGVNIISNDSLRKSVTDLFELQMERVKFTEAVLTELNRDNFRPYFRRVAKPDNECTDCISLKEQFATFERMRQNVFVFSNPQDDFLHLMKERYNILRALKERYLDTEKQIDKMVGIIDQEVITSND